MRLSEKHEHFFKDCQSQTWKSSLHTPPLKMSCHFGNFLVSVTEVFEVLGTKVPTFLQIYITSIIGPTKLQEKHFIHHLTLSRPKKLGQESNRSGHPTFVSEGVANPSGRNQVFLPWTCTPSCSHQWLGCSSPCWWWDQSTSCSSPPFWSHHPAPSISQRLQENDIHHLRNQTWI